MSDKAKIRLRRRIAFPACLAKVTVLLDDQKIGTIGNGKEEVFEVEPGQHAVKLKHSLPITLDFESGAETKLECGIKTLYYKVLLGAFCLGVAMMCVGFAARVTEQWMYLPAFVPAIVAGIYLSKPGAVWYLKKVD